MKLRLLPFLAVLCIASCTLGEYDFVNNRIPSDQPSKPSPSPEVEAEPFVPVIRIDVKGGGGIESKEEYVKVNVTIQETEDETPPGDMRRNHIRSSSTKNSVSWDSLPTRNGCCLQSIATSP